MATKPRIHADHKYIPVVAMLAVAKGVPSWAVLQTCWTGISFWDTGSFEVGYREDHSQNVTPMRFLDVSQKNQPGGLVLVWFFYFSSNLTH